MNYERDLPCLLGIATNIRNSKPINPYYGVNELYSMDQMVFGKKKKVGIYIISIFGSFFLLF